MSTPLRVLVVTVVHDPEDARIRHRQIPAMVQAGYKVVYAAPFSAFGRTPPEGVRGLDLPRAQGRHRLHAVLAARRLIARVSPAADIVLLHDPDLLLAVAGQRHRAGTVVWDVHEDTAAALSMRSWIPASVRPLLRRPVLAAEHLAERRYHLLLAEPGYQRRFSRTHPVVPNTVRVPEIEPAEPGDSRVMYLGKITAARGGHELIDLARRMPEIEMTVIGPAEADVAEELTKANDDGVLKWTGFVPNTKALGQLPGALAGISLLHDEPNYRHSPPTKIMEYFAHGVPVITTPNPASSELVTNSGGGAVVPFRDVEAVADVLREWIGNADERRRVATRGYEYARRELDWTTDAARFVEALREFSGGSLSSGLAEPQ